ncbi:MAG: AAA family ATPase [Myxococcales bacterium]|nr:AAA family ATPase [Myxococcales bacterium]
MAEDADGEFRGTERFQVLGRIGAGGMGVVYEATDGESGRRVALKTLTNLDGQALLRFKNEFRALADLSHPNLVSLGELLEVQGAWFFTMEYVPGVDFMTYVCDRTGAAGDTISAVSAIGASGSAITMRGTPAARPWTRQVPTEDTGPPHAFDEIRLRSALVQLARGLCVLHNAGKVHRDIKPANIRVTPEGHVVLLDFGLVSDLAVDDRSTDGHIVGTASYMAPEQAASERVGPEADWYAVGVLLYEALVGRLPYTGSWLQVIMDKQMFQPPRPRARTRAIPRDLDALCMALLAIDPRTRPTGREVLARLGAGDAGQVTLTSTSSAHVPPFVGRRRELELLDAAFEDTTAGAPVAVLVEGESGVGKSALVRRFLDALAATEGGVTVLAGRCYERESVPYKAFDGVIDALSHFMMRLDDDAAAALLPRQAGLMAQVFPVLRQLKPFTMADVSEARLDPQGLRAQLFAAVRETLARLVARGPLVITIDDMQWADQDSRALLAEVLRAPDAPALLLIATVRPEGADTAATIEPGRIRRMQVQPLDEGEAQALAKQLLARSSVSASRAADIAREAGGHPFFIDELVRFAQTGGGEQASGLRLDEALLARVAALPVDARTLIEVAAVAGGPLRQASAARAASLAPAEFAAALALLRAERLLRTSGVRGADTVEPYHDRIREAVTAQLADDARRGHQHELAVALEGSEYPPDPELLAAHWLGAGERERAATWTVRAAQAADQALAFDRAVRLYRSALELLPARHPDRRSLTVRLGDALVNAGRGKDGAEAYLAAAVGASASELLDLRRKAAEQLLKAGHVDEGVATLREVLDQVGIAYPTTPRRALISFLLTRVRLRLRGMKFRERDATQLSPEHLRQIDACWGAAGGFAVVDPVLGAALQGRHLQLALAAGEPYRVSRALALEAGFLYALAPARRNYGQVVREQAHALATRLDHPHALAMATGAAGIAAQHTGRWRASLKPMDAADAIFRDGCTGTPWERAMCELFAAIDLFYLGDLRGLGARGLRAVVEADERGDLFQADTVRVQGLSIAELADDKPDEVDRSLAAAIERWPNGGYIRDCAGPLMLARVRLYAQDGARARTASLAQARQAEAAGMLHNQHQRLESWHVRGAAALAAALDASAPRALLAEATKAAGKIDRERMAWSQPLAGLLRAGVAAVRGEVEPALALLADATAQLDANEMALYAAAARRRAGQLRGGDEGAALVAQAEAWMTAQGVKHPARMSALLAPGFRE